MLEQKKKVFFVLGGLLVVMALLSVVPLPTILAQVQPITVSGWMWSDNIGWSNTNGNGGNVTIDPTTGQFSGYAWSDNIGWINFNPGGTSPDASPAGVRTAVSGGVPVGEVTGWARACSVFVSGCAGTLNTSDQTGGWDGWIKMINVQLDSAGNFSGFAWGDLNLGWIDLSGLSTGALSTKPTLSVSKVDGDNSGVATVTSDPAGITFPTVSSSIFDLNQTVVLTSDVNTCWTGCQTTVTVGNKTNTYQCLMDNSRTVQVGCNAVKDCSTDPSLCGCVGSGCSGGNSCVGNSCACTGVNNCDCVGTPQSPYTCTDNDDTGEAVVNITSGVGGTFKGISYSKTGDITYPTESFPFTVTIDGLTESVSLSFDWPSSNLPTRCAAPTIAPATASCSTNPSSSVTVSPSGNKFKLCFNQCLTPTGSSSYYNGTWSAPVKINGQAPASVNGNTAGTVILKYSYATHQ